MKFRRAPPKPISAIPEEADTEEKDGSGDAMHKVEIDEHELEKLPPGQRKIIQDQTCAAAPQTTSFFQLFRFHTRFELFLNLCGLVTACAAGATQPLMTLIVGNLVNAFGSVPATGSTPISPEVISSIQRSFMSIVKRNALYYVGLGAATFLTTYIYMATFIYTGERASRRIREKYLEAVLRQNIGYYDVKLSAGEVTTRIKTDCHLVQEGISDQVPRGCYALGLFVTGFAIAFVKNWRLALVVASSIPAMSIFGGGMAYFMSKYKKLGLDEGARAGTLVEEVVSNPRTVQAFGTQKKLTDLYATYNERIVQFTYKSAVGTGFCMGGLFFCLYSLAFYYGTTLLLQGRSNAGQVFTVFFSVLIGAGSMAMLGPSVSAIASGKAAATSLFATIDRVPIIDTHDTSGLTPGSVDGVLRFENVALAYPSRPSIQVLRDFTATFPAGKVTALVGASGAGKSSIVALIERFYNPIAGTIRFDETPISDLSVRWLRSHIGLVSQEPTLFATTVALNIEKGLPVGSAFGNDSAEERRERVMEAARQANAHEFIMLLPEQYDTLIGERGALLSGGQKQRVAIARAIISDPRILLLDEATSALDTASEGIVQAALDKASKGRTTVVIAHRLSTIKNAHQIIVMDQGRIVEHAESSIKFSAHDVLLQNPLGNYSRLVSAQEFRKAEAADLQSDSTVNVADEAKTLLKAERAWVDVSLESDVERVLLPNWSTLVARMVGMNINCRWTYVVALFAAFIHGCVYPVMGITISKAINVFYETGPTLRDGGDRWALWSFVIALGAGVSMGVLLYTFNTSSGRLAGLLRIRVFAALLRQDISFHDKSSSGNLASSVSDWPEQIDKLFSLNMGMMLQSLVTIVAGVVIGLAWPTGWRVALVGTACIPLLLSAGVLQLVVIEFKDERSKQSHEDASQAACEAAASIRTVASLGQEMAFVQQYSQSLDGPAQSSARTAFLANGLAALAQGMQMWVMALLFFLGARWLIEGKVSSTAFFVTLISIVFSAGQAGAMFTGVAALAKGRSAAGDIFNLLDRRPVIDAELNHGRIMQTCEGAIRFTDVHFSYPSRPHIPVLQGLSIDVQPGQFVAICGTSGCGKSTLIQLLERFYDSTEGEITIDGVDIKELGISSYRRHVSLVAQEPQLYIGTIRFNIMLGLPGEGSQEELEQACRDANIFEFIESLPDKYETEVGGKGIQLSGGQKQRVALARALIRNPKILLLDEATSALDSESEKVVQTALDRAAHGRSTIAVAHRLSTIQGADMIYVLRDGKVAEKGKHFELIAKQGLYSELVTQQDLHT